MKAKMTVYKKGGKLPKKEVPAHLKSTTKSPAGTAPAKSGGSLYVNKDGSLLRTYANSSVAGRVSEKIDTTGYSKGKDKFPYEQVTEYATYKEDMPRFAVKKTLDRMNEGKSSKVDNRTGTVKKYQNGGKMPVDPPKAELAKKLFGEMPKFDKNKFRKEMMGEKINKLQKEYDYWINKGERTAASGVKVQMDKIREDMKKYSGGGKMNVAGAKGTDQYKYLGYGKKK